MRRLIINADDFGLTRGVNRGIVEAHAHGVVTSTTLMAAGDAFDDAISVARSAQQLSVGCHLVLIDGRPVLSASKIPTLANHGGQFEHNLGNFALRAACGRIDPAQLQAEAIAQIGKLQSAGISVSHIDTHKHTHLFPRILPPLLKAARKCGVRAVRNPFGRVAFSLIANRPHLWKRYGQMRLLNALAARFHKAVTAAGMATTDGSLGVVATGSLDERLFELVLQNLPEGTWELVTHPGYNDDELAGIRTRLRESRNQELRILTADTTRQLLVRNGIELISYRDLA